MNISKTLQKVSKEISIKEMCKFLMESESLLKAEGFVDISWGFDSGWDGDGFKRSEDKIAYVNGSRPATVGEIAVADKAHKEKQIQRIIYYINGLNKEVTKSKKALNDLVTNLNRFQKDLSSIPSRQKDIDDTQKGIIRLKKDISNLETEQFVNEPFLKLPPEELFEQFMKIHPNFF